MTIRRTIGFACVLAASPLLYLVVVRGPGGIAFGRINGDWCPLWTDSDFLSCINFNSAVLACGAAGMSYVSGSNAKFRIGGAATFIAWLYPAVVFRSARAIENLHGLDPTVAYIFLLLMAAAALLLTIAVLSASVTVPTTSSRRLYIVGSVMAGLISLTGCWLLATACYSVVPPMEAACLFASAVLPLVVLTLVIARTPKGR